MRETGRVLVTAPAELPVTRTLAKLHIRETDSSQDDLIDQIIAAATEEAEQRLWRKLVAQVWDFYFDTFPLGGECFGIPFPPLRSITAISYVDVDGATQALSPLVYQVDASAEPGIVRAAYNTTWPITRPDTLQAVTVRAAIGYVSASKIPRGIIQGILLGIGDNYAHRESVVVGTISAKLPRAAEQLLDQYAVRPMVA